MGENMAWNWSGKSWDALYMYMYMYVGAANAIMQIAAFEMQRKKP